MIEAQLNSVLAAPRPLGSAENPIPCVEAGPESSKGEMGKGDGTEEEDASGESDPIEDQDEEDEELEKVDGV